MPNDIDPETGEKIPINQKIRCKYQDEDCEYRTAYDTCDLTESERADCCPAAEEHVEK